MAVIHHLISNKVLAHCFPPSIKDASSAWYGNHYQGNRNSSNLAKSTVLTLMSHFGSVSSCMLNWMFLQPPDMSGILVDDVHKLRTTVFCQFSISPRSQHSCVSHTDPAFFIKKLFKVAINLSQLASVWLSFTNKTFEQQLVRVSELCLWGFWVFAL